MKLPLDIFDSVFALLSEDPEGPDVKTLKACNLVSFSLSKTCEPHLFACVYLPDIYDPRCRMSIFHFSEILRAKPHVARYVRRLGLLALDATYWTSNQKYLCKVVQDVLIQLRYDNIRWFKIYAARRIPFIALPGAITDIMKLPTLEVVHIHSISQMHGSIFSSPRNRPWVLDIGDSSVVPDMSSSSKEHEPRTPSPNRNLHQLIMRYNCSGSGLASTLLTPQNQGPFLDISHLKVLQLGDRSDAIYERTWNLAHTIALSCARNLTTLKMSSFPRSLDGVTDFYDIFKGLSNTLETLVMWHPRADVVDRLLGVPFTFTSLTEIQLDLFPEIRLKEADFWEKVDLALCDEGRYPLLEHVPVEIQWYRGQNRWQDHSDVVDRIESIKDSLLPMTKSRGIRSGVSLKVTNRPS
ncbi:hypothetical protein CVT24_009123 [Panaeolus cyanescens]|uniref:F-box domain-containing protein n=1 Tax=Panaeolus cyanescens TaxID=181874 RepID=A0A409VAN2_9AGAR|nr:hypothetical protein CVT24_009123 [Panaeolus cyanescens]